MKQGWAKKQLDEAKKEWEQLPSWIKPLFQIKK